MAAYVIAYVDITDPVRYEEYKRLVPPTLEQYGGKFIVRGGKLEALEGDWKPKRLVVVEFESFERAMQWYTSTEYAKAKELRQQTAISNVIIVEGV